MWIQRRPLLSMISGSATLYVAGQDRTARDATAKARAWERQVRHRLGGFIGRGSGAILAVHRSRRTTARSYRVIARVSAVRARANDPGTSQTELADGRLGWPESPPASSSPLWNAGRANRRPRAPRTTESPFLRRLARPASQRAARGPAREPAVQPSSVGSAGRAPTRAGRSGQRTHGPSDCGRDVQPALAKCPRRQLGPRGEVEPLEQPAQVRLDGLRADPERAAISSFERPSTTSRTTSSSRSLSRATAAPRPGRTPNARPPAAARRIASRSSAIGAVLSTKPAAPSRSAASAYCG